MCTHTHSHTYIYNKKKLLLITAGLLAHYHLALHTKRFKKKEEKARSKRSNCWACGVRWISETTSKPQNEQLQRETFEWPKFRSIPGRLNVRTHTTTTTTAAATNWINDSNEKIKIKIKHKNEEKRQNVIAATARTMRQQQQQQTANSKQQWLLAEARLVVALALAVAPYNFAAMRSSLATQQRCIAATV